MSHFDYLKEKIELAQFQDVPFKHIYIENFFSNEDFSKIIKEPEVLIPEVDSDKELLTALHEKGFEQVMFPGTAFSEHAYLKWHRSPLRNRNTNVDTCEGFGLTMRLITMRNDSLLKQLDLFLSSPTFLQTLAEKFSINLDETYPEQGLQKYLDGYEISPHPDMRKKALTYMININPHPESELENFHTHYMRFKPEWKYVQCFWEHHPDVDRCWVPWDWCETVIQQKTNNSAIFFAPSDNTLHAIKARYDHLKTQRTQLYGNLWYIKDPTIKKPNWHDFQIIATPEIRNSRIWNRSLKKLLS